MPDDNDESANPLARLAPNGTAVITIGTKAFRLRRPKVGEFRRLRESFFAMSEEVQDVAADTLERIEPISAQLEELSDKSDLDPDDRTLRRDLRRQASKLVAEQRDRFESLRFGWIREVFDELSENGHLPEEDDDLEPWLIDPRFQAELVKHWQTRPLARGGR